MSKVRYRKKVCESLTAEFNSKIKINTRYVHCALGKTITNLVRAFWKTLTNLVKEF